MSDFALVTGGSRNIGAAIARRLTQDGLRVLVVDVVPPEHDALDAHFQADFRDLDATRAVLAKAVEGRRVTRLVNNAGIVNPASLEETTTDSLEAVSTINLKAPILCAQAVLPSMKAAGLGRIVNISSRAALGKELRTAYAATKAGLHGMTRTWALELGRHGITVNAVGPGPIRTSLFEAVNPPDSPRTKAIIEGVPVGRLGTGEDVAEAVAFFASERSGFVTGQVLYVCGGMTVGLA
ncbi:MAG: SDR family oxidoreductase [Rhizobiales bacterium]|nr:SDR family oxidoreductase [Hyphomicrobiales bacterium]